MIASCPLTPADIEFFLMSTVRSRALRFPDTESVMSTSPMVWFHLYGREACSASSFARAAASSSGVGVGRLGSAGAVFLLVSLLVF